MNLPQASIIDKIADHRDELLKKNKQLNQRIKRLEEAGDAMEKYCSDYYSCNKWYKAKEAKP